jgi:hypothetical protein
VALEEVIHRLVGPALALPRRRPAAHPAAAAADGLHPAAHVAGEAAAHPGLRIRASRAFLSGSLNASGFETDESFSRSRETRARSQTSPTWGQAVFVGVYTGSLQGISVYWFGKSDLQELGLQAHASAPSILVKLELASLSLLMILENQNYLFFSYY